MLLESARQWARMRVCEAPTAADVARDLLAARRVLQQHLPVEILHDPSADMLLSLFVAAAEGVAMGAEELGTTTSVGPAVALRWIRAMIALDLIESRGEIITLTASGHAAVSAAIAEVATADAAKYVRRPRLRLLRSSDPGSPQDSRPPVAA